MITVIRLLLCIYLFDQWQYEWLIDEAVLEKYDLIDSFFL